MIKEEQGRMSLLIGQLGTNQRADKRLIPLSSVVNQGEEPERETAFISTGAWRSSRRLRVLLYRSADQRLRRGLQRRADEGPELWCSGLMF